MNESLTISERLARYVSETRLSELPSEVPAKARQIILDTIGCMVAGYRYDALGPKVSRYALASSPPGHCTIFGATTLIGPEHAALANGTAAHVLELDDCHAPSDNHVAVAVVPAALAM